MISLGITSVIWFFLAFGLIYGESVGHFIGSPASFPLLLNIDLCTSTGYPMARPLGIPALLFAGYQMMFAVIAPALITGAFADRVQFPAYLLFISVWIIVVYCPVAHWIWNPDGFLNRHHRTSSQASTFKDPKTTSLPSLADSLPNIHTDFLVLPPSPSKL
jgi:Amt family ammonium transporter